jgi:hypothetical protein
MPVPLRPPTPDHLLYLPNNSQNMQERAYVKQSRLKDNPVETFTNQIMQTFFKVRPRPSYYYDVILFIYVYLVLPSCTHHLIDVINLFAFEMTIRGLRPLPPLVIWQTEITIPGKGGVGTLQL